MASHFTNHGFYQEHVPQRLVYPKMQVVSSRKYSSKRKGERNNYIQNVCVCVWVYIYIYIYREREREREREGEMYVSACVLVVCIFINVHVYFCVYTLTNSTNSLTAI